MIESELDIALPCADASAQVQAQTAFKYQLKSKALIKIYSVVHTKAHLSNEIILVYLPLSNDCGQTRQASQRLLPYTHSCLPMRTRHPLELSSFPGVFLGNLQKTTTF